MAKLHQHPGMQKDLGVPIDHVIIDHKEWRETVELLEQYEKDQRGGLLGRLVQSIVRRVRRD